MNNQSEKEEVVLTGKKVKHMKIKDLISELQKVSEINPDLEITAFAESFPYRVESVIVDKEGKSELSHINLVAVEL